MYSDRQNVVEISNRKTGDVSSRFLYYEEDIENFSRSSVRNSRNTILMASFGFGDGLTSLQLGIAALKPSFDAAAYYAFKAGGKGNVPFHLKKDIFQSYKSVNNNALRLGSVSSSFAKTGANIMRVAAPALTATAVLTNAYSIVSDGKLTWGDAFVGANTALQFAFPVYGVAYGIIDVSSSIVTGKSLTDHAKDAIDSNLGGSIGINW
jgi:hypothetical protein